MHGPHLYPARSIGASQLSDVRAILLDIEGTTTPIEFVHQVLFPYARARAKDHLDERDVAALRAEHRAESSLDAPPWNRANERAAAEAYVYWLMDRDRKSTALKALQGRIWEAGYRSGELQGRGEVYPDVRPALLRWRAAGKTIAIFSSGSVQAQRNLFANTTAGDLSGMLAAYFDTTTGPKRDPQSYRTIAVALERAPAEVLFISDVPEELDAARAAGMQTALCVRDPDAAPAAEHPRVRTFDEVA